MRHDLETLGPNDKIRDVKLELNQKEGAFPTIPAPALGALELTAS